MNIGKILAHLRAFQVEIEALGANPTGRINVLIAPGAGSWHKKIIGMRWRGMIWKRRVAFGLCFGATPGTR
jgi:hypothetical protein